MDVRKSVRVIDLNDFCGWISQLPQDRHKLFHADVKILLGRNVAVRCQLPILRLDRALALRPCSCRIMIQEAIPRHGQNEVEKPHDCCRYCKLQPVNVGGGDR